MTEDTSEIQPAVRDVFPKHWEEGDDVIQKTSVSTENGQMWKGFIVGLLAVAGFFGIHRIMDGFKRVQ